jgi:ribonuclease D
VLHLHALADRLGERLDALGRLDWLWQDGARQLAASWDLPYPANPHHEYRTAHKIPLAAQVRLAALLHWRERVARDGDRPRTWIIDNAVAMELAVTPPANGQALLGMLQACRAFPRPRAGEVIELLQRAAPDAAFQPAPAPFDRDTEQRMKKLRDAIDARAAELAIDPSTLCTRRLLEARVRDGRWPADCTPWRVEMLEPLAIAAL